MKGQATYWIYKYKTVTFRDSYYTGILVLSYIRRMTSAMSCSPVMTNPCEKLEAQYSIYENKALAFMDSVVCSVYLDEQHNLVHSSNEK